MTKSTLFKLLFAVMVVIGFTGAPGPAFAQHGGGGGFHGGGGGGGRPSGGPGRSNSAAPHGGSFGARGGNSLSAGSRGSSVVSANRALSHIDNNHFGTTSHVSSSFSGSHTNTSFSGSRFGNTTLTTNHFSGATNTSFASGRSFSGISTGSPNGFAGVNGFRGDSIGGFRGGFGRGGRFRGGFGCFGCGFGFGGFGFGPFFDFGWGWPGFYGYDPFWYGSYSGFGYPYDPGSGYSGYSVTNSDPDYSSSNQNFVGGYSFSANNNLAVAAPGTMMNDYSSASNDNDNLQPALQGSGDANPVGGSVAGSAPTALIYLKNGTTYSVTDYWLQGGQLHYTVNYGAASTLKMKEVDLQRTVDENARRGIGFSLRPHPLSVNSQPSLQNQGSTGLATTPARASGRQPQTSSQSQT
jgi:hypothetical protein